MNISIIPIKKLSKKSFKGQSQTFILTRLSEKNQQKKLRKVKGFSKQKTQTIFISKQQNKSQNNKQNHKEIIFNKNHIKKYLILPQFDRFTKEQSKNKKASYKYIKNTNLKVLNQRQMRYSYNPISKHCKSLHQSGQKFFLSNEDKKSMTKFQNKLLFLLKQKRQITQKNKFLNSSVRLFLDEKFSQTQNKNKQDKNRTNSVLKLKNQNSNLQIKPLLKYSDYARFPLKSFKKGTNSSYFMNITAANIGIDKSRVLHEINLNRTQDQVQLRRFQRLDNFQNFGQPKNRLKNYQEQFLSNNQKQTKPYSKLKTLLKIGKTYSGFYPQQQVSPWQTSPRPEKH